LTLVANLALVLTTPAVSVANSPPVTLTPLVDLLPVSLRPMVQLDLRISPRIFEKICNETYIIFRGLGEDDSWKKPEAKIL
jgi:hypothetical protein